MNTINFENNEIVKQDFIELKKLLGFSFNINIDSIETISPLLFFNFLREQFWLIYDLKEINSEIIDPGFYRQFEKICLLQAIDFSWSEHLQKMNDLRESIGWRAYAQRDPLIEYKQEGYRIFTNTLKQIRNFLIYAVLSVD
jgi:preprotein translocase subunit SecA